MFTSNVDVTKWSNETLDKHIDVTMEGFTVEQVGHMAWYLGVKHESMLREREIPKGVYADKDTRLTIEHFDEPADEKIPEQ